MKGIMGALCEMTPVEDDDGFGSGGKWILSRERQDAAGNSFANVRGKEECRTFKTSRGEEKI